MLNINNIILAINNLTNDSDWTTGSTGAIDTIKVIIESMIVAVVSLGVLYVIVLSVHYAKAESGDAKAKAQRRIVNAVIGFVSFIVAIILMYIFIEYIPEVSTWVRNFVRQIFPTISDGASNGASSSIPPSSTGGGPIIDENMQIQTILSFFR